MVQPFISIIVPVYNVGEYLEACINSILQQTYEYFELLLVDDGSTDGSGDICDMYGEKDSRIRVFHKDNGGVSSARNVGLDHAIGEWVYFVDSDDEVLIGGVKSMVDCIGDDVDIVLAGYEQYNEDGTVSCRVEDRIITMFEKRESLLTVFEGQDKYYETLGYVFIRLLRNRIIQDHHLRFDTQIKCMEDSLFLVQYICRSRGITRYMTRPVYKYFRREDSTLVKWRREFSVNYADCLFALVRMKQEIEACFPRNNQLLTVVRGLIWGRYNRILGRMNHFGVQNDELQHQMEMVVIKELGIAFFVKKKLKMIWRSIRERFSL